jgi:hypothetical protein
MFGDRSLDEEFAMEVQSRALSAIKELNAIAALPCDWTDEKMRKLRKAIGLAIGTIDYGILKIIYQEFPERDDLKDMDLSKFDDLLKS